MFILTKLILENYIPLLSSGIKRVELDLNHLVNLLIAQNGVGKTSILREANPLAPENANYRGVGRKYVEIKRGLDHFVLDSKTDLGNGHSFKFNGKELNKNGTFTEQKDLVWIHFRLDSTISRILSGLKPNSLFSAMPVAQRKDFFMFIYPNDTSYALGVFNKLKTERRELAAAIKNQVMRYTEESAKLKQIAECGPEELERRVKTIETELRESLLVRGGLEQVKVDPELQSKIDTFKRLAEQMTLNRVSGFFETEAELRQGIETVQAILSVHEGQATAIQMVISEHVGVLEGMEEIKEDPFVFHHQAEQLKVELTALREEYKQHGVLLGNYPLFNDDTYDFTGLELVYEALVAQLRRVVNASTPELTGGRYKEYTVKLEQTRNQLRASKNELDTLTHQLKHYDAMELVTCPECTHEFKVGITANELRAARVKAEALKLSVTKLERDVETLERLVEQDSEWYHSMLALHQFCRMNGDVKCLPELIKAYDMGKSDTNILLNALRAFMGRFNCKRRIDALLEEEKLLNTRIGLLQKDSVLDIATYLKSLEHDLEVENSRIGFYRRRVEQLIRNLKTIHTYTRDLETLRCLKDEIFNGLEQQGLVELRKRVDERIHLLTDEKDEYLASIIKSRSLSAVVASISEDIDRLKRRLKIVDGLMNGLCPNKGLIGKLMTDFIKTYCANMNAVIQSVWNTTLFVKPCHKDNGDLNWKFPVVTGDDEPTPDVSDCSLGEAGIIDFAFRYVAIRYHGNFPLMLDEVGTTFDEIKRGRFFNFIHELTTQKDAKQLFMISHYITQYGMFTNPNVIAMCYEGLSLPGEVNQHSVIN
ncbi:hypothetical protein [Pseudomonas aeruginosa]|uniref:hypothetical protein n=1 Tax=Pseudomonas aeruginosa TaxID=287 RepID=UPI00114E706F|nr:hypothetical protein [Pseudomonas aeruginosa]TQH48083.1 hypothetical protein FLI59_32670 [Pseudomonas aeruginosa]